jgi:hypothetical protein
MLTNNPLTITHVLSTAVSNWALTLLQPTLHFDRTAIQFFGVQLYVRLSWALGFIRSSWDWLKTVQLGTQFPCSQIMNSWDKLVSCHHKRRRSFTLNYTWHVMGEKIYWHNEGNFTLNYSKDRHSNPVLKLVRSSLMRRPWLKELCSWK